VLDILPAAANAIQVRTAIMAVRPYGRVVLMGGVGMLGGAGLACLSLDESQLHHASGPVDVPAACRPS